MVVRVSNALRCFRLTGMQVGQVCSRCEGKCVSCLSYMPSRRAAYMCDSCGHNKSRVCIICGGPGAVPAHYCNDCVYYERDRDGCPNIINNPDNPRVPQAYRQGADGNAPGSLPEPGPSSTKREYDDDDPVPGTEEYKRLRPWIVE